MKKLYSFTVLKEEEVEKEETSKNEAGDTVITKTKVKETVPHKFFIAKPWRTLTEEFTFFSGREMAKALSKGMMTRAQLEKRFLNDGGILSEDEKKYHKELLESRKEKAGIYERLSLKSKGELSEEEKKQLSDVSYDLIDIFQKLQNFELDKEIYYTNTAETWVRNRTTAWWVLFLSYYEDGKPFIEGEDFDQKINNYDAILDSADEFKNKVLSRFTYFIMPWATGLINIEEDFQHLDKQLQAREASENA